MSPRVWGPDPDDGPTPPPAPRPLRPRRRLFLLTTRGFLPVAVCNYCAALTLRAGADQHDRTHAATDGQR